MFERISYGLHGRIGGLPARLIGYGEEWDGDDCVLWAEGEVRQTGVFFENLVLRRRIEARVGESHFTIHDVVENAGHSAASHMLLYHCNIGFPIVDEGSELLLPTSGTRSDPWGSVATYRTLTAPQRDFQEACFYERILGEPSGTVPAGVVNRRLGLGVFQVSRNTQLPEFMVWRMMGEGNYAVALEPGTNRAIPRADLADSREIIELEPGATRTYDLEVGVLDGDVAIDSFAERVGQATTPGPRGREGR
jgi:hypothetical protein